MKFFVFFLFFSFLLSAQEKPLTETEIPYPWEKFQEEAALEEKLQSQTIALSYHKAPLREVVEEWERVLEVRIVLASEIYVYRNDDMLRLTLSTEEIPFSKALDLAMRCLDLIHYLDQNTLVIALPGSEPPEDPDKKHWKGLQNARIEYATAKAEEENAAQMRQILNQPITLELAFVPIDRVIGSLSQAIGSGIFLAPEGEEFLRKQGKNQFSLAAREKKLQEVLDDFCRENDLSWRVEASAIYITLPHLLPPGKTRESKRELWKNTLAQKISFPGRHSLAQIVANLRSKVELVVERNLWDKEYTLPKSLSLEELLDLLCQGNNAAYVLGEDKVVYLIQTD